MDLLKPRRMSCFIGQTHESRKLRGADRAEEVGFILVVPFISKKRAGRASKFCILPPSLMATCCIEDYYGGLFGHNEE